MSDSAQTNPNRQQPVTQPILASVDVQRLGILFTFSIPADAHSASAALIVARTVYGVVSSLGCGAPCGGRRTGCTHGALFDEASPEGEGVSSCAAMAELQALRAEVAAGAEFSRRTAQILRRVGDSGDSGATGA